MTSANLYDNSRYVRVTSRIEEVTGVFAQHMLAQAGLQDYPNEVPLVVLENSCGRGIMTLRLQEIFQDRPQDTFEITCGDRTDAMVELTRQRIKAEGWTNTSVAKFGVQVRATCSMMMLSIEAKFQQDTKLPDEYFTHIFTNFEFMALPDSSKALMECHRVVRPGGSCGFTTWGSIPWLSDMRAAIASVPGLPQIPSETDIPNIFSKEKIWHDLEAVQDFVAQHGFIGVKSKLIPLVSVSEDPEELRTIMKSPLALITEFFWTQQQRDEFDNPGTHHEIFAWFENKLRDGPLEWKWSAVVTTCRKPA